MVDAFFSDLFSIPASKQRDYKITSSLAELLLEASNNEGSDVYDGFAYPSVAHRGGLNYVIKPTSFDNKFYWKHFMSFEIHDYLGFGLYGRKQYAKADDINEDGSINWVDL